MGRNPHLGTEWFDSAENQPLRAVESNPSPRRVGMDRHKNYPFVCTYCGAVFQARGYTGERTLRNRFCNRSCRGKALGPPRGTNGPGRENAHWKGGKTIHTKGYIQIRRGDRYQMEHRLAMGVDKCGVVVHHIDGVPTNNSPENLEVMTTAEHSRLHRRGDARGRLRRRPEGGAGGRGLRLPPISTKGGVPDGGQKPVRASRTAE